ncbi:period circadian protein homolog 2 isoform X2 [Cololabis saira]|uniref:period circadian protein homolog 2 isoform X2 n=1 Tax=Cololabis saira TaxID=129043 RepID=UPI002AD2E431|nr:period circadian protein homolog 2 isoform X2 [Cololabis saira]
MSEDSDFKPYRFPVQEEQDEALGCTASTSSSCSPRGASRCSSMAQLHRMGGYSQAAADLGLLSESSDSSGHDPAASRHNIRKMVRSRLLPEEDVEMKSNGSSVSGTESHGNESHGNESHGNESHGHESLGSSNGNSKDSALLESSESNKSSNSHSPSPPSSSNAFSLLSSEQDNPSTSGCSSQESAKAKTQKEVIKTLKELKRHLPAEKKQNNKSTTLNTLKYALRCVKQVEASEEYYQLLMINDSQPSGLDVSSYTIEEIDSITSEYTLKNNDIFAVAVSLTTGRIVYISDQAASILNCKRDVFKDSKFVEFLTPQDVSVFYSFTTPYHLPSWSMCTGAESSPPDCIQEKSFFCRIGRGKDSGGDLRYYPFRMTPYLMKVQDTVHAEDQFCCLLLAERVHSGYDAPRIPTDKRVFTTTHTPSCVFQDVDERAVPLLGYLPQDLIGTPILLHLHPNDRQVMLAIHKKILQCAGQPFDHSSIRFCAKNGEYITLDTSWSSFVNPWSRKVSFVIGRHKVRMGPVNEDIFSAPNPAVPHMKTMDSDVQELTEQIHRLLLQPVHNSGSSGYSSQNSTDQRLGLTCSTESLNNSNGSKTQPEEVEVTNNNRHRTFHEICKGVHRQKSQEQQKADLCHKQNKSKEPTRKSTAVVRPKDSAPPVNWKDASMEESRASFQEELPLNDQTVHSYQQISCLDSVIRYLDGCNVPMRMKRKCHSSSNTTSSNSDEEKQKASEEITEDVPGAGETPEPSQNPVAPPCAISPPYRKLGLTKEVLATHTQKEEQVFLNRIKELRGLAALKEKCPQYLEHQTSDVASNAPRAAGPVAEPTTRRATRHKKTRSKRAKRIAASDSTVSSRRQKQLPSPQPNHRLKQTSWSTSEASQSTFPVPYPAVIPGYPMQAYPTADAIPPRTEAPPQNFESNQFAQAPPCPPSIQSAPYNSPLVTPVVALVLPNYLYPLMGPGLPPQPVYQVDTGAFPYQMQPFDPAAFSGPGTFASPHFFNNQNQFNTLNPFPSPAGHIAPPFEIPPSSETPKPPVESHSRSSTPRSGEDGSEASPPLFQSRCSSPLNLLELELSVDRQDNAALSSGAQGNNTAEREKGAAAKQAKERELKQPFLSLLGPPGPLYFESTPCVCERLSWDKVWSRLGACCKESSHGDGNNSDDNSSSSDMFDLILQEDSCSGTGSATSGSMGSGSNGCGTSASGTSNSRTSNSRTSNSRTSNSRTSNSRASASGTSTSGTSGSQSGSNNTSNYYGSVDSSQRSQKVKSHSSKSEGRLSEMEQSEQFIRRVLQEPLWLLTANTDEEVMMTYQLPSRDLQQVLREDKEKLRLLQKGQPSFSEEQKKELTEVHPWIKKGALPKAIDIKGCFCCDDTASAAAVTEAAEGQQNLNLGDTETEELSCHQRPREDPS